MTHTASPTFDIPYSLGDRVARLDALWRANVRNMRLLRAWMEREGLRS